MLSADKDYHVNGNIISAVFYKSRTNATNVPVDLIFDKQNGFSKCLTLLHFAIENNIVKKQGNKYYVPGYEDYAFAKYTFCEEVINHPMMLLKLYKLCLPYMSRYLGKIDSASEGKEESNENIEDMMDDLYSFE